MFTEAHKHTYMYAKQILEENIESIISDEFNMDNNKNTEEQSQISNIRNIFQKKSHKKTKKAIQIKQHCLSEKSCKQCFLIKRRNFVLKFSRALEKTLYESVYKKSDLDLLIQESNKWLIVPYYGRYIVTKIILVEPKKTSL